MAAISIEKTQELARALPDSHIESATALVQARQPVAILTEQLAEVERADKRAYVRAAKDGWSADEHKKLGLEISAVGRPRVVVGRSISRGLERPRADGAGSAEN